MKITAIETTMLPEVPFPEPIRAAWSPGEFWRGLSIVVVRVVTDDGIVGIGAGNLGEAPRIARQVVPALIGQDPLMVAHHARVLERIGGVWSVETALWDIVGKTAGLPLFRLWGGFRDRVKAYASLCEVGTPTQRAEDAHRLLEEGFRAIKLRLHNDTLADDLSLVRAVRLAVGDDMEIMVDANQANLVPSQERGPVWNLQRAIWTAKALEDLNVTWLEEPLGRYDWAGLSELRKSVSLPIAGGENNRTLSDFSRMVHLGVYDIFQPDVLVSGISNCGKIAALAEATGRLSVGHHGGTALGFLSQLHLNAACPNAPYVEYFYDPPRFPKEVFQGILAEPIQVDSDGYLRLPEAPGLGTELDEAFIARYRVHS